MKRLKANQRATGFALTELLIALAIVAAAITTIAMIATGALSSSKASDQARIIDSIGQDLQTKYQRANNFAGLTTASAIALGIFPEQMVNGTTVLNTWNGTVTTAPAADINGVANRAALVTWTNVPADECSSLSTASTKANRVRVGTTVVQQDGTAVNIAGAGTACSGNTNTVDFLYHKT